MPGSDWRAAQRAAAYEAGFSTVVTALSRNTGTITLDSARYKIMAYPPGWAEMWGEIGRLHEADVYCHDYTPVLVVKPRESLPEVELHADPHLGDLNYQYYGQLSAFGQIGLFGQSNDCLNSM